MGMGEQHGIEPPCSGIEQLLAQIRRRVDQNRAVAVLDEQRDAPPAVLRLGRIAVSPIAADRGTPPDEPQPSIRTFMRIPAARGLVEQAEEILGRHLRQCFRRKAAQLRQERRGMDDESRLVALAAMRHRRQVRRVGLDQDPVERHRSGDGAQLLGLLEGDDPGERQIEAEIDGDFSELRTGAEAMYDAFQRPLTAFLATESPPFRHRRSRVWTISGRPARARRRGVCAEDLGLSVPRAVVVMEIETAFADADDLRMARVRRTTSRHRSPARSPPRADGSRPSTRCRHASRRSRAPRRTR